MEFGRTMNQWNRMEAKKAEAKNSMKTAKGPMKIKLCEHFFFFSFLKVFFSIWNKQKEKKSEIFIKIFQSCDPRTKKKFPGSYASFCSAG